MPSSFFPLLLPRAGAKRGPAVTISEKPGDEQVTEVSGAFLMSSYHNALVIPVFQFTDLILTTTNPQTNKQTNFSL